MDQCHERDKSRWISTLAQPHGLILTDHPQCSVLCPSWQRNSPSSRVHESSSPSSTPWPEQRKPGIPPWRSNTVTLLHTDLVYIYTHGRKGRWGKILGKGRSHTHALGVNGTRAECRACIGGSSFHSCLLKPWTMDIEMANHFLPALFVVILNSISLFKCVVNLWVNQKARS